MLRLFVVVGCIFVCLVHGIVETARDYVAPPASAPPAVASMPLGAAPRITTVALDGKEMVHLLMLGTEVALGTTALALLCVFCWHCVHAHDWFAQRAALASRRAEPLSLRRQRSSSSSGSSSRSKTD